MIKKSYETGSTAKEVGPKSDLVDKETATETGGRGFNLVEMTSTFDGTDPEIKIENEFDKNKDQIMSDKLLNMLLELGDGLDASNEESFANFTDFLIKKIAETKSIDYSVLFNQLMIKVNNTDLVHTNEIIKKLTKIYSKTLLLEYIKNSNLEKSKESAYKKVLHRAEQYLSED
jgi:hypothetical protein